MYNGFTNYETWLTNLYLDDCYELIEDCQTVGEVKEVLQDVVKEYLYIGDGNPLASDILENCYFSQVDFDELAALYFADMILE